MVSDQDSILNTIKKLIGIENDYDVFDADLISAINGSFMILNQLGVGPLTPFLIEDDSQTWNDFSPDMAQIQLVKEYIKLRTRLLFDPPSTGVLHEAIERQISEFEWRLMIQAEEVNSTNDVRREGMGGTRCPSRCS